MHLRPPELRRAMGWLNCLVGVPASEGHVTMQLQGRLAFLAVPEHSPGVHRGMMLPPAALQVLSLLAFKLGTQVTSAIKQASQCLHVSLLRAQWKLALRKRSCCTHHWQMQACLTMSYA